MTSRLSGSPSSSPGGSLGLADQHTSRATEAQGAGSEGLRA